MIRRPPRSTQGVSSAASDVYKRQFKQCWEIGTKFNLICLTLEYCADSINQHHKVCQNWIAPTTSHMDVQVPLQTTLPQQKMLGKLPKTHQGGSILPFLFTSIDTPQLQAPQSIPPYQKSMTFHHYWYDFWIKVRII